MSDIRTLVVDDNADIRRLLRTVLTIAEDFTVIGSARNGAEAVQLAEASQPELVLLDVLMPHMDGVTALPLIREAAPDAKLVFVSVLDEWMIRTVDEEPADLIIHKAALVRHPRAALNDLRALMGRPTRD